MNEQVEVKAGDKVVMNRNLNESYGDGSGVRKGEEGEIVGPSGGDWYDVKFKKGTLNMHMRRCWFDVIPSRENDEIPESDIKVGDKEPVKRGIRITAREVSPDVFKIVDFTALKAKDLPLEYTKEYPWAGIAYDGSLVVSLSNYIDTWIRKGDRMSREKFDDIIKTCREAGERLRKINTFPKEPFEIVI